MILNVNAWTNCQLHVLGCFETLRRKNRRWEPHPQSSAGCRQYEHPSRSPDANSTGFAANLTSTKEAGKQGPIIKHNPRMIRIRASVNFLLFVSYRKHLETNGCCKAD